MRMNINLYIKKKINHVKKLYKKNECIENFWDISIDTTQKINFKKKMKKKTKFPMIIL